jgi:tRNA(adenine34) deaminase
VTDEALSHHDAMGVALAEAQAGLAHGDVPVGAVVIHDGRVLARRHNERELRQDPTAHAELLALRDAAQALGTWRLDRCTLVVTLEPCVMCAGALVNARIGHIVYGAPDLKAGGVLSLYGIPSDPRLNHNPPVQFGLRAAECAALLTSFFEARRSG